MTEEKKKELFPYFAYLYSKKLNPEKYGNIEDIDKWTKLIEKSPEDINIITETASKLTDEDWNSIEQEYMKVTNNNYNEEDLDNEVEMAKKGAKLQKLQAIKKGKKIGAKKCSCGCDMITSKAKGGKLIYKCGCGCGAKK